MNTTIRENSIRELTTDELDYVAGGDTTSGWVASTVAAVRAIVYPEDKGETRVWHDLGGNGGHR